MSGYGESLLSKVLDTNDAQAFKRFGVNKDDFATDTERQVYEFISEYAEVNRGQTPDYRTVVEKHPDFYYREGTTDQYEWLVDNLKQEALLRKFTEFAGEGGMQRIYDEHYKNPREMLERLKSELDNITMGTDVRNKVGTNLKVDGEKFLDEYERRKEGKSFKVWASKFPTVNAEIGGYYSGNTYAWIGRSGRGKSIFVMEEALEAAVQGANVLIWAMEMSWFEWMARAYASLSAREGYLSATIDGVDYEVGFENKALLAGKLTDEWEQAFRVFLADLNAKLAGNITVRAVDDEDFMRRDVRQLEADIMATEADVVVIDAIYHMDYEQNTSKVAGGDVANTSKKLRALAGRSETVIHVITQAEEVKDDTDDEDERELRPAKRSETKKTKAVLEDSTNLFGIDSLDGRGAIELGKGRSGGEGVVVEVIYLPNYGLVKELEKGEALAGMF